MERRIKLLNQIVNWLEEYKKYVVHFHGKFYDMMPDGEGGYYDPSIDYKGIVKALTDMNYGGWISSEWEGQMYYDAEDPNASKTAQEPCPPGIDMVAKQLGMIRKYEAML